jgi:hypothetical protein
MPTVGNFGDTDGEDSAAATTETEDMPPRICTTSGSSSSSIDNTSDRHYALGEMKRWLADSGLREPVVDELIELGAGTVNDVVMIVEECEDMLQDFARLDAHKLKKTVKKLQDA